MTHPFSWFPPLLWLAVLVTAVAQLYTVQWHRGLMRDWQAEDQQRQSLIEEYSRLLLEKSTLASYGRIDRQARERLGMKDPKHTQVFQE